jgi:glyoxylate reductase
MPDVTLLVTTGAARVFVTRELRFPALDRLRAAHEVDVWADPAPPPPEALRERAASADGLLTMLTDRVDADLLDACPRLRAVANMAVGTDNVDLDAARERGVAVGNTPGVLTDATADLTFALILAITRRLPDGRARVLDGRWGAWQPDEDLGMDLAGATLGLVGWGRIAQAVAQRARAFGMEIVHSSRSSGVPLDELLARADVVSLHTPFRPDTRHLVDAAALRRMRPTAYLVNTARGGVVDTEALRRALIAGEIAGAALDVTDPEPLPADHPLLGAPNLLVVPHIGSATTGTRARMAAMAVDNLLAALDGRPMPHPAD